ncbi:MAG: hypothetical protein L0Y45_10005 [Woeseiaceae bacterium]|nr:hypothetical protein [Woeseiaceae bacterium]
MTLLATLIVTALLSFAVLLAVIAAMSVGVVAGRRPVRGSCGGLNGGGCELCGGNCEGESRK